jgi:hypothetical protein
VDLSVGVVLVGGGGGDGDGSNDIRDCLLRR